MKLKISLKRSLFTLSTAGAASAAVLLFVLMMPKPAPTSSQTLQQSVAGTFVEPLPVPVQPRPGLPIRLKIPAIDVDAAIENVGLTADGAMDVPKGPGEVAWFDLGKRPGEEGSAVMAGHFGWKNGLPAVFDDLHALHAGDTVIVENDTGETMTFVVRELRTYDLNADAPDVFGSSDGKAHLNLITCEGTWNAAKKSFSNRLVVFTDKESRGD